MGEPSESWDIGVKFRHRGGIVKPVLVVFLYRLPRQSPALPFVESVSLLDFSRGDVRVSGHSNGARLEMVPTDQNVRAFGRVLASDAGCRCPPRSVILHYRFPTSSHADAFVKAIALAYPDGNVDGSSDLRQGFWEVTVARFVPLTDWSLTPFEGWYLDFEAYLAPHVRFCLDGGRPRAVGSSARRLPGSFESGRRR
jgi:hypothetical protein